MSFPNKAGKHEDTDQVLTDELKAAGIKVCKFPQSYNPGEVKTLIYGSLHDWIFTRNWYYWVCKGPGIDIVVATKLHSEFGKTVRVNGDCGCPSPLEMFKGLGCGNYHVDDQPGLNALAKAIDWSVKTARERIEIGNQFSAT